MAVIKMYKRLLSKAGVTIKSYMLSQSGYRAKLHSVGEIALASIKSDLDTDILEEPAIILLNADVDDTLTVKIMNPDRTTRTVEAWKLKAVCTELLKVYSTGTTVADADIYITK